MTPQIKWKPSRRDIRLFGAVLLVGFGIIGAIVWYQGHPGAAQPIWIIAGAVGLLAIIAPPLARPFYLAWMAVAFVMGTVMSFLIVTIIFYGIITPVALVMRLAGRDALALKRRPDQTTYWTDHPPLEDKSYYERLF